VVAFTQRLERRWANKEKEKEGGRKYIWSEEIEAAVRRKKSSYLTALRRRNMRTGKNTKMIDEMLNVYS
jgi:hypothetical protein